MIVEIDGKKYESESERNDEIDIALENSQKDGFSALFMPKLIDLRTKYPENKKLWNNWYFTPSIKATGTTNQGSEVVVYVHKENYFSDPNNLREATKKGLVKGARKLPQKEFQKYVDEDGIEDKNGNRLVWVIPYQTLKSSSRSGGVSIDEAFEHPQTIPFLGGEQRAIAYFGVIKQIFKHTMSLWHSDDLSEEALARFLVVSYDCSIGLDGYNLIGGRFIKVRELKENLETKVEN